MRSAASVGKHLPAENERRSHLSPVGAVTRSALFDGGADRPSEVGDVKPAGTANGGSDRRAVEVRELTAVAVDHGVQCASAGKNPLVGVAENCVVLSRRSERNKLTAAGTHDRADGRSVIIELLIHPPGKHIITRRAVGKIKAPELV
ncbi:hypothetical protein SDC9_76316 [bioreactor metagenome]|uniref:Uncharacterized protein n=1 Tax=bioreactor metagenome TaxID=1076179 RepID=A0A644YMH1_9ZZZZ